MRRGRAIRVVAAGVALAGVGAVVSPAMAGRPDGQGGAVIECSNVPGYGGARQVSGFEPWAGPANGPANWYGVRSGDPYYVAYVNPTTQEAAVYLWQPWYDSTPGPGGAYHGPYFVDMSVHVSKNGVATCNKNYAGKPSLPTLPIPPRIP